MAGFTCEIEDSRARLRLRVLMVVERRGAGQCDLRFAARGLANAKSCFATPSCANISCALFLISSVAIPPCATVTSASAFFILNGHTVATIILSTNSRSLRLLRLISSIIPISQVRPNGSRLRCYCLIQ